MNGRIWLLFGLFFLAIGMASSAGADTAEAEEARASIVTIDGAKAQLVESGSGHLVFVRRLSNGNYVPTSLSMLLLVLFAVFLLKRKKKQKGASKAPPSHTDQPQ